MLKRVRNAVGFLLLASLLALPGVAAFLNHRRAQAHTLPDLGRVPTFAFVDQLGRPFASTQLAGHIWVADFIFTSCGQICPRMTAQMQTLGRRLDERGLSPRVQLLSFSVDPQTDTPERLRAFAANYKADAARWHFLTGPVKEMESAVVGGFHTAVSRDDTDAFGILHGTRFVLIDAAGALRGYYDPADDSAMVALLADAERLARAVTTSMTSTL